MKGRIVKLGAIAVATAIGFATLASMVQAQGDVIKDRQELMKSQGAAMKAINGILEANGPLADIAPHAAKLEETSAKIADLFPAGSDQGDTKAKPEIWTEMDKFRGAASKMQDEMVKLNTAAKAGNLDAMKAAVGEVGKACKGCHDTYRKE